ncbi:MAG TPA: hypothetical protein PKN96_04395 [Flavobacterium sp.]|uniref:hypothetical protein n=1 Tax=Flavobacterium sp. TaxID=239 RepID=UPI002BD84929|nr:hypothetical protein [Flavobacterium sp.]HNP32507.1 hypothetical protein [Flavobacterium sp.]
MKFLFLLLIPVISFSQKGSYAKLTKLPKSAFEKAVNDSIVNLEPTELTGFLKTLKNEYKTDLKPFSNNLNNRFENCKWPVEMNVLFNMLLDLKIETTRIENSLNNKKDIWDKDEWGEKFWQIIRKNKLKIKEGPYYSVDENGQKKYNLRLLLEDKMSNEELGANPLLYLNNNLKDYEANRLYETLQELSIKDISIVPISDSVELYGDKGINGMIKVLTR